ncbi:MAG: hypothetical protein LUF04_11725 [Bacteroides sp.]|nr:hypothetical protein [Bacteroides sp.]
MHGARRRLEPVLRTLGALCLREGEDIETYLSGGVPDREERTDKVRYPLSLEKILRMYRAVVDHGFTGYTEA